MDQFTITKSPPVVTNDLVYLRLIGDKSIKEEEFGKKQKDRQLEMKYCYDNSEQLTKMKKTFKIGVAAANNHYAGFWASQGKIVRGVSFTQ